MRISAIIPIHDEEAVLRRVLVSVERQSRKVDELVLVLDACTDGSETIAQETSAKLIRVSERNMATAVLAGIAQATHDLIVLFDGNTVVPEDFVARLLEVYEDTHADLIEWHGGMMFLPRGTLDKYGPFSTMDLWTLEYFLRLKSRGGKVVHLNGAHERLKRSPLRRNIRYGFDYADLSGRYQLPPFFRIGTKSGLLPDLFAAAGAFLGFIRRRRFQWVLKELASMIRGD